MQGLGAPEPQAHSSVGSYQGRRGVLQRKQAPRNGGAERLEAELPEAARLPTVLSGPQLLECCCCLNLRPT